MYFFISGSLDPLAMQNLLLSARVMAAQITPEGESKPFLEFDEIGKEVFTFMASNKTDIYPDYYNLVSDMDNRNFAVEVELGYVGKSSMSSCCEFKDLNTNTVYAKNIIQIVAVGKKTRRPVPIPEWWQQKYSSFSRGEAYRLQVDPIEKPQDCFDYKVIVRWSDTDAYRHTNYLNYVKFCRDAASDAVDKGYFSHLEGDLLNYSLSSMQMTYKSESLPSQELLVSVWEDGKNSFLLHFDISRDGNTIFQSSLEFYPPSNYGNH